jgi:hypothetical protein
MREMTRKTVMAWKPERQEWEVGDEAETKSGGLEDQTTWAKTKADHPACRRQDSLGMTIV